MESGYNIWGTVGPNEFHAALSSLGKVLSDTLYVGV